MTTFNNLTTVLAGWVFAKRHTVARMILAVAAAKGTHTSRVEEGRFQVQLLLAIEHGHNN